MNYMPSWYPLQVPACVSRRTASVDLRTIAGYNLPDITGVTDMALNKTDKRRQQICVIIEDNGGSHALATMLHVSRQAIEDWYRRDVPSIPRKHWPALIKMGVSLADLAGIKE